jgi:hypothetical protein
MTKYFLKGRFLAVNSSQIVREKVFPSQNIQPNHLLANGQS